MHSLPIILATFLSVATTVPVSSPGIKQRIFGVANEPVISPEYKERIFNIGKTEVERNEAISNILQTTDLSSRNSMLEGLLWNAVDLARDLIINGNDVVPVLDPFELEELHLDGDLVDLPDSHVTLKNIQVLNLGTFEIDRLAVSTVSIILQRFRIDLDGRIPVLVAQAGNYDLSMIAFGGHIFGNGDLKVQIVNPRLHGYVVVGLRMGLDGIFITIRECRLNFNLEAFKVNITGLFGDPVASEFVSEFLSTLVPDIVDFFQDDISDALSNAVLEIGNDILGDLNLISLLP